MVVEDDLIQQEVLLLFLAHSGHEARGAKSGAELDRCLQHYKPEIFLLDYNLPDESGMMLAKRMRAKFGLATGIIMVTARSQPADRVECRRAGVDCYLVKPVDFNEMLAVIDNLLLRLDPMAADAQIWKLSVSRSELLPPEGAPIPLLNSELMLLAALAGEFQFKASREMLIRAMGKDPLAYDPRALETCISRLRRKLGKNGRNPLQAMRGKGYQFTRPLLAV